MWSLPPCLSRAGFLRLRYLRPLQLHPACQAVPTTTGSQTSFGTLSGKRSGPATGTAARTSFSSNASNARDTPLSSDGLRGSLMGNVQNASLATFQQRSSSQEPATLRTSSFSTISMSLVSLSQSSAASTGNPKDLADGFSLTHASCESTLTTSTIGTPSTTASARSASDRNSTMSIFDNIATASGSAIAEGTRGGNRTSSNQCRG